MSENRKTALLSVVLFVVCLAAGIALTGTRDRSPATSGESNMQPIRAQALEQTLDFLSMNRSELIAVLGTYSNATLRRTIRSIASGGSAIDPRRQSALRTAMNLLAERDPEHFFRWIDTAGLPPGLSISAVETAATLLAAGDPGEGFAALKKIGSFQMRRTAMLAYGAALAEREPETVLRQLSSVGWGTDGARIVGSTMAARDPEEAANFFAGLHQASNYSAQIGLKYVMPQWARTDPEAAFKWANAGSENWYTERIGMGYLINELGSNPDTANTALEFLAQVSNPSLRAMLSRDLGRSLAGNKNIDSEAVINALKIANPFDQNPMLAELAGLLPADIAATAIDSLAGQKHRQRAIESGLNNAADRTAALSFVDSLSNPADRIDARASLFSNSNKDPAEAVQVALAAEFPRERAKLLDTIAERVVPVPKSEPAEEPNPFLENDPFAPDFSNWQTDLSWLANLPQHQRQEVQAAIQRFSTQRFLTIPEAVTSALNGE